MTYIEALRMEFDEEMKSTRRMLECVPEDKLDWKPHEKSMNLGRLAGHVAELPARVADAIRLDTLVRMPGHKTFVATSRQELLQKFDGASTEGKEALATLTDDKLDAIWTLKMGDRTLIEMPRGMVLRRVAMDHLIHHRAQLGVFLRLLDVAIPGAYGPSADDMAAAKRAN